MLWRTSTPLRGSNITGDQIAGSYGPIFDELVKCHREEPARILPPLRQMLNENYDRILGVLAASSELRQRWIAAAHDNGHRGWC